jgi:hypothetical protein
VYAQNAEQNLTAEKIRLDWIGYDAANYAALNWHYSKKMPMFKSNFIGVWEYGKFKGVIIFGRGANAQISKAFGLEQIEVCELTRVALTKHSTPVSKCIAIACRMIKQKNPKVRVLVSYADSHQGHHGGIYQAANWIYLGETFATYIEVFGKIYHGRPFANKWPNKHGYPSRFEYVKNEVDPNAKRVKQAAKYKYVYPLDAEMKSILVPQAKPYPKRVKLGDDCYPQDSDGATPIHTLHT